MEQKVYKQDADYARQNDELALYRDSNWLNTACAEAIDRAIKDSNYELYRYDLGTAAQKVIAEYGAERVEWVLAATLQNLEHDGRFSHTNKNWGKDFPIPQERSIYYTVKTHPAVLDGFLDAVRKVFTELEQDTPDKIARDYNVLMESFDPFSFKDLYGLGHLNIRGAAVFEFASVKKAVQKDARTIAKGGRDFDTIIESLTELTVDISSGQRTPEYAKQALSLLNRLAAYAGKHHRKLKKSAPKAEKKTSVLNRLEESKKAAAQETEQPKGTPKRDSGREV